MTDIAPARLAALRHAERQAATFPDLPLAPPDTSELDARDAALAHAIAGAVTRRFLTLETVIHAFLRTPLRDAPPAVQAALLTGAAQLLFLDRVPAHAAIGESVEYAKAAAPRVSGVVNAVLRNLARELTDAPEPADPHDPDPALIPIGDGRARRTRRPLLPAENPARLAASCSLPLPVLHRWARQFGRDRATDLALHTLVSPPVIVNARHAPRPPAHAAFLPHDEPGMLVWTGSDGRDLGAALAQSPGTWVQDPASSSPVELARLHVDPAGVRTVLDLCAGQGTKTRQLAACFPDARVIATDVDDARRAELRRVAATLPNCEVVEPDAPALGRVRADLIVLDVPCSNSAVFPRRPEAKYRWGADQLARLAKIQREIIAHAGELASPGCTLLYATCSLDTEENEDQAHHATNAGWQMLRDDRRTPRGVPGDPPRGYADGSYAALLRRAGRGVHSPHA
ncbi:MAG: transcription antitermination factor NusB [Planctomycetota bacterium]|nr:transcription antitermination factor NusB [Planctomycetota bacterium]